MIPRSLARAPRAEAAYPWQTLVPLLAVLLVGLGLLPSCREDRASEDLKARVLVPRGKAARERQAAAQTHFTELTGGAPARLVWVEDPSEESADTFAEGDTLHLMGWDTREGGPRRLVDAPGNFGRPLLTPDGNHVVFTEKRLQRRDGTRHLRPRIRIVPWQGGKTRTLGRGFAVDTWAEPGTRRVWIYALDKVHTSRLPSINGSTLVRFPLDEPDRRETVWTRTRLSLDSVQVSRDGRRFAALFPWPDAGLGDFATERWTKLDVGCWPALAPDDSYVAWIFDGPHRNLRMVAPENDRRWAVNLSSAADLRGREAYHPRWSNHPQFAVFTGPYQKKKKGTRNAISSGGLSAEVHLGRFSRDLQRLEATVRLTYNKHGDFYPDLWVDGADTATLAGFPQKPTAADPTPGAWPPSPEGLVFSWRDLRAANEVPGAENRPPCRLEARSIGRFTPQLGALLDGGWFEADPESNAAIAAAARSASGLTLQALLTEGPAAAGGSARPLIAWQTAMGEPFLSLARQGPSFHVSIGMGPSRVEGSIQAPPSPGQPAVLALVWQDASLRLAVNGRWAGEPLTVPAGLAAQWPAGKLILGQPPAAPRPPAGTPEGTQPSAAIERLTVHAGALAPTELAARAEDDLAATRDRPAIPRLRVRARVLEATEPDPDSLDTYHRMLVDHTYEVTAVLDGAIEAKKIAVLHWGVLDDRLVPGFPRLVGGEVELTLEPQAAHPELQGELTDLTSDEFGLPLFLDVATPAVPAAP